MANITGLRPVGEPLDPQQRRKAGRTAVQTDTSVSKSLRPTAAPVDTYARAADPAQDNRMMQMAEALGQLSPSLGRLGNIWMEEKKGQATQEAETKINEMTFEEAKAAVESGQLPASANPFFQRAFLRQFGTRMGLKASADMGHAWENDFDKEGGDIEEFIASRPGMDLEGVTHEDILLGYNAAYTASADKLRGIQADYISKQTRKHTLDGAFDLLLADAERGLEGGADPATINAMLRSHYSGNRELLNISNAEQDVLMVQVAERLAEGGHLELVKQMLTDDRGGIGSILDKRGEVGAAASSAVAKAESVRLEQDRLASFDTRMNHWNSADQGRLNEQGLIDWHKANPGHYSDSQIQSLIDKSRNELERRRAAAETANLQAQISRAVEATRAQVLDTGMRLAEQGLLQSTKPMEILNPNGNVDVMTSDEVIAASRDYYFTQMSPAIAAQRGETAEQTIARESAWAASNGVTNPEWERVLNTGGSPAFMGAILDGHIPPNLEMGYRLYTQLRATSPSLLEKHIKDASARDFYDTIRVAEEYGGLDFGKAVTAAFNIHSDPETLNNPFMRQQFQDMDQAILDLNSWGDGWGDVGNGSYASRELEKASKFFASRGLGTEQALEEGLKRVKATHSYINGYMVRTDNIGGPQGLSIPAEFTSLVPLRIDEYAKAHGDELLQRGLTTEDITAVPVGDGTGAWMLVEGESGDPLDDRSAMFTPADLLGTKVASEEARAAEVAAAGEEASAASATEAAIALDARENFSRGIDQISSELPTSRFKATLDAGLNHLREAARNATGAVRDTNARHNNGLTQDEMDAVAPPGSETPNILDLRPAVEPDFYEVPADEDPDVIEAVSKLRAAGITKEDFAAFDDRWANLKLGIHPTIREKLYRYLPSS